MKQWTRKETGQSRNPYYYECSEGSITVELNVPYPGDPWVLRLYQESDLLCKKDFCLKDGNLEDPAADLEKAEDAALRYLEKICAENRDFWNDLESVLSGMRTG